MQRTYMAFMVINIVYTLLNCHVLLNVYRDRCVNYLGRLTVVCIY